MTGKYEQAALERLDARLAEREEADRAVMSARVAVERAKARDALPDCEGARPGGEKDCPVKAEFGITIHDLRSGALSEVPVCGAHLRSELRALHALQVGKSVSARCLS
jgi:hypothetical protein